MKLFERILLGFSFVATFGIIATLAVYCSSNTKQSNLNQSWHPNNGTVSSIQEISKVFNIEKTIDNKIEIKDLSNKEDVSIIKIPSFVTNDNGEKIPVNISTQFLESIKEKRSEVKTLTIGGNVDLNILNDMTFKGNNGNAFIGGFFNRVENLEFENGITTIPGNLFVTRTLKKLKLPNSLEIIGERAFSNTRLTELELPNSIKTLESQCFAFIPTLANVTFRNVEDKFPSYRIKMGSAIFQDDSSLTEFTFSEFIKDVEFDFLLFDKGSFPFYGQNSKKEDFTSTKIIKSSPELKAKFMEKSAFSSFVKSQNIKWNE